jgi:hypothetical protein
LILDAVRDSFEEIDLEGFANVVAGEILDGGLNGEEPGTGFPIVGGSELELLFVGLGVSRAIDGFSGGIEDADHAEDEGVIERFFKADDERLACAGLGRLDLPLQIIYRLAIWRADAKLFLERRFQRIAVRVFPGGFDDQRVRVSCSKGWADFLEGTDAALDPARVEEKSEARHFGVPQFLVDFQKGQFHWFAGFIEHVNMVINPTATHGCRKVNVKLEEIFRQQIRARIDAIDDGGGFLLRRRYVVGRADGARGFTLGRRRKIGRPKGGVIGQARIERKLRIESDCLLGDGISAKNCGKIDLIQGPSLRDAYGEKPLPLLQAPFLRAKLVQTGTRQPGDLDRNPPWICGIGSPLDCNFGGVDAGKEPEKKNYPMPRQRQHGAKVSSHAAHGNGRGSRVIAPFSA